MKVGVVGASGYAGGELLRLLAAHPVFKLCYIGAGSAAGSPVIESHPHLASYSDYSDQRFQGTDLALMNACELIFFALPHGESAKLVPSLDDSVKVVDLGADFRLRSSESWRQYYGGEHAGTWVYGLPEIRGQRPLIRSSQRIANPGCYATAISLAAAPAIEHAIIDSSDIVVVASSGTTGAGRKPAVRLLASEVMGSLSSYKFGGSHQHTPEIEETLESINSAAVRVSFTPILAPMPRGILATTTAKLLSDTSTDEVREIYLDYYSSAPFVKILPEGILPQTGATIGSNMALIQVAVDSHSSRLIISSAIDNLGKGAASQAIHNANLVCGIEESSGLLGTLGTLGTLGILERGLER
jgi:N-acetyl-gamma-glutamyl-phosphate reductase